MKTVAKFILNRDDKEFWYVEKAKLSKKSDRMRYFVHQTPKHVIEYSDHTFHDIHSIDEKVSINDFTNKAINNLLSELYDEKNKLGYDFLMDVHNKINSDSNRINPNLKGVKSSLLNGISIYNETLLDLDKIEVPYEENYRLIKDEEEKKLYVREKVRSISSLIPEQTKEEEVRRIYVTPVKELVRKKVA